LFVFFVGLLFSDLVLISGDLSSLSLASEFEYAKATLQPILDMFPTMILPGNHDQYTTDAVQEHLMEKYFAAYMKQQIEIPTHNISILGLNPCRPTGPFTSSGKYTKQEEKKKDQIYLDISM
jgi:3',5'-cyclic AMP phosphodiesterase CpdA